MHKFRAYASMFFKVPAALLCLLFIILMALAGWVNGYGFLRTGNLIADEVTDALRYARVRLAVGKRK